MPKFIVDYHSGVMILLLTKKINRIGLDEGKIVFS